MHPMLNTAIKAARRAGSIISRASMDLESVKVGKKGPGDYVTEIDHQAEAAIIEILSTAYPDHAFLGEESGDVAALQAGKSAQTEYTWIIDPIDGTANFVHGVPHYAVSIALSHRGQITQACIFDPTRNELFTATRGGGAFMNDRRVRVSKRIKFGEALLASSFGSREPQAVKTYFELSGALHGRSAGIRRTGSSVLDMAWLAAGRTDGYFAFGLKPWDMAAASLLLLEAGGLMSDAAGNEDFMKNGSVVAASPKIFGQLLPLITPYAHLTGAATKADSPSMSLEPGDMTAEARPDTKRQGENPLF